MTSTVDLDAFSGRSPRLSYDILLLCFTFIASRRDVSSLMRTCKTLFGPGIPHLLESTVRLHSIEKTVQFLDFIFSKSFRTERSRNLRSMSFGLWGNVPPEEYQILSPYMTRILRFATNLEDLDLPFLNRFCEADPSFSNVVASLPCLRRFHIGDAESKVMDLLSSIHSPLQELDVSFSIDIDLPDPLPYLGNLGSTLTTLTLRYVHLRDRRIRCNSVRFLTIETHFEVDTTALVLSFPSLISLYIGTCNGGALDSEADQLRAWNQGNLAITEQWTTLRELSAEAVDIYVMGLTCPIHSLEMRCIDETNLGVVRSLLDFHRPQHVRMSLSPSTLVAPENTSRDMLEHLSLSCTHLMLDFYSTQHPIDAFLVALGDRLHGLPLTHIHISLSIPHTHRITEADMARNEGGTIVMADDGQESALNPLEVRVPDLEDDHPTMQEMGSLVGVIATRMPTLVRIGFDVSHAPTMSKFWDVCRISMDERDGQQVFLKEINWCKVRQELWRAAKAGWEN